MDGSLTPENEGVGTRLDLPLPNTISNSRVRVQVIKTPFLKEVFYLHEVT